MDIGLVTLPADELTDTSETRVVFGKDYITFAQDNDFICLSPECLEILRLELAVRY